MNNTGETGKDTSRHDTSTFEEAEEMECEYCGLLRGFKLPNGSARDPTESESWNFFHGPCSSCSAEDGSLDSPLLCSVCNHMRLRHLIECLSHDRSFLLQLGTVRELQERPDCSFCNFIFDTVIKLKKNGKRISETMRGLALRLTNQMASHTLALVSLVFKKSL